MHTILDLIDGSIPCCWHLHDKYPVEAAIYVYDFGFNDGSSKSKSNTKCHEAGVSNRSSISAL